MNMVVAVLIAWLSSNFDLPVTPQQHPSIQLVSQQQLALFRYGAMAGSIAREPVAVYHDKSQTIYLSDNWTGATPAEVSVLVHELVHHLQNVGKLTYRCAAEREALAYAAQEKWLKLFAKDLETEFEIDPMTLKVTTACM